MKKIILWMMMALLACIPFNDMALEKNTYKPIRIMINDDFVSFKDVQLEKKEEIIFVPIRFFVQALGGKIEWNEINKNAVIKKGDKKIIVNPFSQTIFLGKDTYRYKAMFLKENRIMISLNFIVDYLGYEMEYSKKENIIKIKNTMQKRQLEKNNKKENLPSKIGYITFDDGPSKYTKEIVEILEKYEVQGTFFMLSNNINKYSEDVKLIIQKGNAVGLHGVTHRVKKAYESPNALVSEMKQDNDALLDATGMKTNLIRTPYGSKPYMTKDFRDACVKEGFKMWDWNVDSKDSLERYVLPEKIISNIKEQVSNQKIPVILLHEKKSTVEALEEILYYLKQEGYTLMPIDYDQEPMNFWNDTR